MIKSWLQLLANTLTIFAATFAYPIVDAKAQNITLDGSLGKTETLTGPNYSIPESVGQKRGDNLFHSFGKFNLDTNEAAIFESADNIRNIFSRVTGGSISNIDGLIKANGTANLFLINPSGIIFGENARLDIGGSFVATTADSIKFGDEIEFSAVNPQNKPLLTVNLPLGLQYGQNPGKIEVRGNGDTERKFTEAFDPKSGLKVLESKTLALLGGDVLLEGAVLKAGAGRIELASVKEEGTVNIEPVKNGFAFGFDELKKENFGDIQALKNTAVDATGDGAGDIRVKGKNFTIKDNSVISSTQTGTKISGNIIVNATDKVELDGSNDININNNFIRSGLYANNVNVNETTDAANITIKTLLLTVKNGGTVTTDTFGMGNGGNVNIEAENVRVLSTGNDGNTPSSLVVSAAKDSTTNANAGNLNIKANNLLVEDGAFISANTSGKGNGGNMEINATSKIEITGRGGNKNQYPSGLFVTAEEKASGNSGSLGITTKQMLVENGAFVSASNNGGGSAGSLNIDTSELLLKNNVRFFVGRVTKNQDVGDLNINTDTLLVEEGSSMQAGTSGVGGSLNITAKDIQVIGTGNDGNTPSSLTVSAKRSQTGAGGQLNIETERITIKDGAYLSTGPSGTGNGGDLNINAAEYLYIIGKGGNNPKKNQPYLSGLFASAEAGSTGNAGNVDIDTKQILIKDGARISTRTETQGNGGNLKIQTNSLQIQNGSLMTSATLNQDGNPAGKGGNLIINSDSLEIKNNSNITVSSEGTGIAGDLFINSPVITLDNQGKILADSQFGSGGNITIDPSDLLVMRHNSKISTSAGIQQQSGDGGNININSELIFAVPKEDSNIIANAFLGKGGQVNIETSGIFGIFPQDEPTPFSDITASSELGINGEININQVDVDPAKGLIELPSNLVDATQEVSQSCTPREMQKGSSFVYVGRGGLPMSPNEPLQEFGLITSWVSLPLQTTDGRQDKLPVSSVTKKTRKIIEAQKIVVDKNGDTFLVAESPQNFKSPFIASCSQ